MGQPPSALEARLAVPDVTDRSLVELMSLRDRCAVVTGGARGIGHAVARRFAEAGASVCIADRDGEAAAAAAEAMAAGHGVKSVGLEVDIARSDSVDALVESVPDLLGPIDIWVNNAAIYPGAPIVDTADAKWDAVLSVDLTGTFYCCRAVAAAMTREPDRPGRVIINMSSLAGLRGRKGIGAYVSAKHGVTGLTKALALELAPAGIRVMGVAPSIVDTPGMRERREAMTGEERRAVEELERKLVESIPLERQGVPDDVARMVFYCASDMATWMTGTVVPVDGGMAI